MRNAHRTLTRTGWVWLGALLLVAALTGCSAPNPDESAGSATAVPSPSEPSPADTAEATPEPTSSPAGDAADATVTPEEDDLQAIELTVWMPEALAPSTETPGGQELLDQFNAFDEAHPDLSVQVEVKLTTGPGSTLAYLRSAPDVAPGILPDVALVNLDAMVQAAHDELVVPVNTMISPDDVADFYDAAVELGTTDGIFVGIPYVVEMQHTVYREVLFLEPPNSFERVLESPVAFIFPAGTLGEVGRVNRTTVTQYMEAVGGDLLNEAGEPTIDEDALSDVLQFYADARDDNIIEPALLQLTNPSETWEMFSTRQAGLATVRSTDYLEARDRLINTQFTWVPTQSGEPFTLIDGWMWVVTTRDPDRQQAAMELIDFLMTPVNHGTFTEAVGWLPSQPEALTVWTQADQYASFADRVLSRAAPVPEAGLQAIVGVAIQDALEAVLLDGVAPAQAAVEAAQRVNEPNSAQPNGN